MSTTTPKDEFVKPRKAALYLWTDSLSNLCMLSEVEFSSLDENGKRAVWKQLSRAERERLKVFFPRQQQTEVVQ